jgi:glutathione S-transferase
MTLALFAHPFSSYCQKVLIALYENGTAFEYRLLSPENPGAMEELAALWPLGKFPVLVDAGRTIVEATVIVEHLALHHPGPFQPLPADPRAALPVRMLDRFFDNYVMTPMQKIVGDFIRRAETRDAQGVAEARATLDAAYRWLEEQLPGRAGRQGMRSASPTAPPLPRSSMQTGFTRSRRSLRKCAATARGCSSGPPSRARSMRRGPIGHCSRPALLTGIEHAHLPSQRVFSGNWR